MTACSVSWWDFKVISANEDWPRISLSWNSPETSCRLASQTNTWHILEIYVYKLTSFPVLFRHVYKYRLHTHDKPADCLMYLQVVMDQIVCSNVVHPSRPDTPVCDSRSNHMCTDGLNKQNGSAPNGKHSHGINLPGLRTSDPEPGHSFDKAWTLTHIDWLAKPTKCGLLWWTQVIVKEYFLHHIYLCVKL